MFPWCMDSSTESTMRATFDFLKICIPFGKNKKMVLKRKRVIEVNTWQKDIQNRNYFIAWQGQEQSRVGDI